MPWRLVWTANTVLEVMAGLAMVALAFGLLHLDRRHRVNRAFAFFLIVRGVSNIVLPLWLEGVPSPGAWVQPAYSLTNVPLPFAALAFVVAYREGYQGAPRRRWIPWTLAGLAVLVGVLWLADPSLHLVYPQGPDGPSIWGPLTVLMPMGWVYLLGLVTAILAWDHLRSKSHHVAQSVLLLSLSFSLFPLVQATELTLLSLSGASTGVRVGTTLQTLTPAARVAMAPVALVMAITPLILARAWRARPEPGARAGLRAYAMVWLVMIAAVVVPFAATALGWMDEPTRTTLGAAVGAIGLLGQPVIGAYAVLRHQLFGVDAKARWTVRQSTVAGAFIAVFFVVSEGAQQLFSSQIGPFLGIAAAGVLVFAIAPLQRLAERVGDAAVPGRTEPDRAEAGPKEFYREMVTIAWRDGKIEQGERQMLNKLRERLGLSRDEAFAIEEGLVDAAA